MLEGDALIRANRLNPSFRLVVGEGCQSFEIVGTVKEFAAGFPNCV